MKVNLNEFASVLVFIAQECGQVIKKLQDLSFETKSDDSPVTLADLQVQKTIEVCLKAVYPSLSVVGEESQASLLSIET